MHIKIFSAAALVLAVAATGFVLTTTATEGGCTLIDSRPCFDKIKNGGITILKKNAQNAFNSCLSNSAPNETGTATVATTRCAEEQYSYAYCFEGKSRVYMRRFDGVCTPPPPPPPEPEPEPEPEPTPEPTPSPTTFRVVSPNGGESLAFGSSFPIRWEGGESTWTVALSIISGDMSQVKRRLIWKPDNVANDGLEDWIVDLPPGNYVMYVQACSDTACTSPVAWDYGDASFQVVEGAPLGRVESSYLTNKSIVVLSPSGGESWEAGSSHEMIWSGEPTTSKIYLSLIDYVANKTHSVIQASTENDGKYTWTIPPTLTPGLYTIHVSCTDCPQTYGWYGYSFQPFTVTAPQTTTSP